MAKRTVRVVITIEPQVRERMGVLKVKTGAVSLVDVVRKALAVYDFIVSRKEEGAKIIVRDEKGETELVLL